MIGLNFRDLLPQGVTDELDQLIAGIRSYLFTQHKDDGSHSDITCDSIDVDTGGVTADGVGTFGGNVTAKNGDTSAMAELGDLTGLFLAGEPEKYGLFIGGLTSGWTAFTRTSGTPGTTGKELRFYDLTNAGVSAFRIVYDTGNSRHTLAIENGGAFAIGEDSSGKRMAEVNALKMRALTAYYERGRTTPMGEWVTPAYSAGDFTGSGGMTWGVDAIDATTLAYTVIGKTMTVAFVFGATSVTAPLGTDLEIKIPGGFTAAKTMVGGTVRVSDNGSAGELGVCVVATGGTKILLRKGPLVAAANWTASVNNTIVQGIVTFEVQ